MSGFFQVIPMVFQAFIKMLINPIFWIVVFFISFQYKRFSKIKKDLFGVKSEPIWQNTLLATAHGIIGGLVGSFLMILVGISLSNIGIGFLWVLSLSLMFIHPRFICFAYSGGIIALSSLILGWPNVDVPHLIGLVAILHMVEGLLILIGGHLGAMPIYTKDRQGRVVGGFNLQKFWPIPIVGMLLMQLPSNGLVQGTVSMPEWWPIIKPAMSNLDNAFYLILPVVAALGYGDLAITSTPKEKSKKSAFFLTAYSFILLSLAVAASYYSVLAIAAALFSAFGHEWVIKIGRRMEMKGESIYVAPDEGIMILDVMRGTAASKISLMSGDIIKRINNMNVDSSYDLGLAMEHATVDIFEIECVTRQGKYRRVTMKKPHGEPFGIIPVPESYDRPQVEESRGGALTRLFRRFRK